jgi:predicted secreted protein
MKRTVICLLLVFSAALISAGDLAVLENLGFSADGRYFMFGQHVLVTDSGQAYAETAVVDVSRNDFVPGGWKKSGWDVPMIPNQDSRGALYELLGESADLKNRYGISHLEQGRLLYTRSNGDDTIMEIGDSGENAPVLLFRDFERGREYSLVLYQDSETSGDTVSSSFHVELKTVNSNGAESSYTVGNKGYARSGVVSYRIVRVWIGPDGRSLVIAVAKEDADLSVRYMVETLVLN